MYVIKASGKKAKFQPSKVKKTCLRAGASNFLAEKIVKEVQKKVYNGIKTKDILQLILKLLKKENLIVADRYRLKDAMLELGPAGFIFEKYILSLLKEYHYQAWLPAIMTGACVNHEVDLIGISPSNADCLLEQDFKRKRIGQRNIYMIECKYHNAAGIRTGLKTALYVWARFLDLKDIKEKTKGVKVNIPWLISNTKFSDAAIQYAKCKNMRLLGWKYPRGQGLERFIEEKKVYPITILGSLDQNTKRKMFSKNIILCQDLLTKSKTYFKKNLQLKENKINSLIKEAKAINK